MDSASQGTYFWSQGHMLRGFWQGSHKDSGETLIYVMWHLSREPAACSALQWLCSIETRTVGTRQQKEEGKWEIIMENSRGIQRSYGEGFGFVGPRLSQTCRDVSFQNSGSFILNMSLRACRLSVLKDIYHTRWIQSIGINILVARACQSKYVLTFPVFSFKKPGVAILYIIILKFKTPTCIPTVAKKILIMYKESIYLKWKGTLSCNVSAIFLFMDDLWFCSLFSLFFYINLPCRTFLSSCFYFPVQRNTDKISKMVYG